MRIESLKGEDKNPDLRIHLDRSRLQSVAKPAIGNFLQKLQVCQSLYELHYLNHAHKSIIRLT